MGGPALLNAATSQAGAGRKPLKVVFLSPSGQQGGAESVLMDWMRSLRETSPLISIHLLSAEEGPLLAACRASNISCSVLPFPSGLRWFGSELAQAETRSCLGRISGFARRFSAWVGAGLACFRYRRVLRQHLMQLQPDVIHSNGVKMHLLAALAKPPSSFLIWHLHDYLEKRGVIGKLLRAVVDRCSMLIAVSDSIAADARRALSDGLSMTVIRNAVDLDVFTPEGVGLDLAQLSGLPPPAANAIRVGLIATFAHWKGHEVFLKAAAALSGNYRFYVIGGPIYATGGSQVDLDTLRARARALGIANDVGFTGFIADVPAAIRSLDIVVHASTKPEPFGLVILQAMACERPVVVTPAGGAGELITPDENALAVSPGDSLELALAIERLARDGELRLRLAKAGRVHVERNFSRSQVGMRAVGLYGSVLGQDLVASCH